MVYFGDESGHLRGLLQGEYECCVVAVVGGDRTDCYRCAKRAVRNIQNISEARWNDLRQVEKRRFFECLADACVPDIDIGYVVFTQDQLQSLDNYHYLHQDVNFPPAWDIALKGYAYGELLFELDGPENRPELEFDRFASKPQWQAIETAVQEFVPAATAEAVSSHQNPGIQTADCIAGAVAEQHKGGEPWIEHIPDDFRYDTVSSLALVQLEKDLAEL